MPKKKKVNPRRIPMPKSAVNRDAIIDEAMQEDMYRAWLLVGNALLELEYARAEQIQSLCDRVNEFSKTHTMGKRELKRAEELMGIGSVPRLDSDHVKSAVQLEKFKKKVERVALLTALSVICLGLEAEGFVQDQLGRIFLNADMTMAEIDAGVEEYKELERKLLNQMVEIKIASEM